MTKTTKVPKDFSRYILNCLPSRNIERDWSINNAGDAGLLATTTTPPSKDLREGWWKIGDQSFNGSCVGWATADSVLRWHFVKANRLTQTELLSMRYIWIASKETDDLVAQPTTFIETEGTRVKAALDIARNFGVVLDSILPYQTGTLYQGETNTFYALAAQRRIASYFNLGRDLTVWQNWIANHGPILTRFDVDTTWYDATKNQGNMDTYQPGTRKGGHAVALVGYTSDRFIVRNSWGTDWGNKGFGYASPAYATAAFTEAYGVTL
jgi:hypothetical protein